MASPPVARGSRHASLDAQRPQRARVRRTVEAPALARPVFKPRPDRRDRATRLALVLRVRREFEDMRGMSLTLTEAGRFFGMSSQVCGRILWTLAADGLLEMTADRRYRAHRVPP
jgi:hypothetical protein